MLDQYIFGNDDEDTRSGPHKKILMIDDEPRILESLRQLLSLRGFDTQSCSSGLEALPLLEKESFDLILLDLGMKELSGQKILEHIARLGIPTPVIVVSGENSIDAAIEALRKGVYDFIRKPYEPEHLLRTIDNALHRKVLERTNKLISEKLENSRNLYRYLVDSSPDLIYTLDEEGNFSFINERFELLLGYHKDELLGKHYSFLIYEDDVDRAKYAFNERRTDTRAATNVELRLKCKNQDQPYRSFDTSFVTIVLTSKGLYGTHSKGDPFLGTYGVARDISDRKKAEETIHYQAYHDSLTDLPNRVLFRDRLSLALTQAKRNGEQLAVMLLDLDRFKWVNDTLGHPYGDELLKTVASRLTKCLRKGDTLARLGGDEFTLLLPEVGGQENARRMAVKILDELLQPFMLADHETYISGSIGIAMYPEHGDNIDALLKSADIAMYQVKWEGKNGYIFYNPSMTAVFHRKLSMENELRHALGGNQFVLYYQPQVDIISRRIVGMEALVRWKHPEQGMISPAEFIPLAEETGLITHITKWVLAQAALQCALWRDMGFDGISMSINFSSQDIERSDFVSMIKSELREKGLEAAVLGVEITEGTLMRDMEMSASKLKELSNLGVKIAIDDFGTGYSSLAYLKKFPINTIKIDKSFVHDIHGNSSDTPIVSAVTAIAHGFRMNLIAEGVETPEQMEAIVSMGCTVMQGFLFSRPLTATEATEALMDPPRLFTRSRIPEQINPLRIN